MVHLKNESKLFESGVFYSHSNEFLMEKCDTGQVYSTGTPGTPKALDTYIADKKIVSL